MELAGTVDSIGEDVTRFEVGDRVFGVTGFGFGAHAEYARVPEDHLVRMPNNASYAEAAAIPYGGTALGFLRAAGVKAGQKVLIHGASGSVGTASVQLAKHFGARVTAVCSTANLGLVKSLGADEVIDYTKDDFSKAGHIYDVIHDTVDKSGFWRSVRALKRGGVLVTVGPGPIAVLGGLWTKLTGVGQVIGIMPRFGLAELEFLRELVEQGKFRPVIDRHYPLKDIVEAHRYVETGHKKGNVVIDVASSG